MYTVNFCKVIKHTLYDKFVHAQFSLLRIKSERMKSLTDPIMIFVKTSFSSSTSIQYIASDSLCRFTSVS